MELHQRAPTLMGAGGAGPGAGGATRVWGRSRARLYVELSLALTAIVGDLLYWHFRHFLSLNALLFCPFGIAWAIMLLRRPSYVTTDDAGIAFTRRRKSVHVRWEEIWGVEHNNGDLEALRLKLHGRPQEAMDLGGFGRRQQWEILRLITRRADLEPEVCPRRIQFTCAHWKRRRTLEPGAEQDALPPTDRERLLPGECPPAPARDQDDRAGAGETQR